MTYLNSQWTRLIKGKDFSTMTTRYYQQYSQKEWQRSNRQNPCPVCGSIKGKCSFRIDGVMAHCHYKPSDRLGGGVVPGWLHILKSSYPTVLDQATGADLRVKPNSKGKSKKKIGTNQLQSVGKHHIGQGQSEQPVIEAGHSQGQTQLDQATEQELESTHGSADQSQNDADQLDLIDRVYRRMLTLLSLSEADRHDLTTKRQLSPAEIDALGVKTLEKGQDETLCKQLITEYGHETLLKVPGFYRYDDRTSHKNNWQRRKRGQICLNAYCGQVIPVYDPATSKICAIRIRPQNPRPGDPKYFSLSSANNGGPGMIVRATVYRPLPRYQPGSFVLGGAGIRLPARLLPALPRASGPAFVGLTEGEYKAFIAAQQLGQPFICVPGTSSWRTGGAVQLAARLAGELAQAPSQASTDAGARLGESETAPVPVVIFYDSELNQQTTNQRDQLADALRAAGLKVEIAVWRGEGQPGGAKGIDDLLLAGGQYRTYKYMPGLGGLLPNMLINQPKLNDLPTFSTKAVLIRSPKGTGKTHWLTSYMARFIFTGGRILDLTHRISLGKEASRRHGISNYLEFSGLDQGAMDNVQSLVITPDSLSKLNVANYQKTGLDLLLIDESEQFLHHLAGQTIRGRRYEVLAKLSEFIGLARQVIFLDADISPISYNFLIRMGLAPEDITLVVNEAEPDTKTFVQYERKTDLIAAAVAAAGRGERIAVAVNSRQAAKALGRLLVRSYPDKRGWCVHSKSANNDEARARIERINETVKELDWLVYSPSLGTGVSIDGDHFDTVYLIGESGVNTHKDLLQQAARVRSPRSGQVHCWVKNYQRSDGPTDPAIIEALAQQSALITARHLGQYEQVMERTKNPLEQQYATLKAEIQADRNASWSDLAGNFWRAVELEGHAHATALPRSKRERAEIREILADVREELHRERAERIKAAPDLGAEQYLTILRTLEKLPEDHPDHYAAARYSLKSFYGESLPIDDDLIEADDQGRIRAKIINFLMLCQHGLARQLDEQQFNISSKTGQANSMLADISNYGQKNTLRVEIMTAAGLADPLTGEVTFKPFTHEDLIKAGLAEWLDQHDPTNATGENNRQRVTRLLGLQITTLAGLTRLVTGVLAQVGLLCDSRQFRTGRTLTDPDTGKSTAERIREYSINAERLELMQKLAEARLKVATTGRTGITGAAGGEDTGVSPDQDQERGGGGRAASPAPGAAWMLVDYDETTDSRVMAA